MKNLVKLLIDLLSFSVVLLFIADFLLEGSLISFSLSTSGFNLIVLGHVLSTNMSITAVAAFISLMAMRFLLLHTVVGECACQQKCPCRTRDKSARNDRARRSGQGTSIWSWGE